MTTAKYEGHCDLCDQPIRIGTPIATVHGAYVHRACAEARWGE